MVGGSLLNRNADYLIVSGVPRSGTSLMMRMLAMGGLPILTDGVRSADEDNPHGYFEWEPAKDLPQQPELIGMAAGKVVKIFSGLLQSLPADRRYRILFMRRPAEESIQSQEVMLDRNSKPADISLTSAALDRHIIDILRWANLMPHVELMEVPYHGLLDDPAEWSRKIAAFAGEGKFKRVEGMVRAVRPELYRQRAGEVKP
jgi:hypothetical protein